MNNPESLADRHQSLQELMLTGINRMFREHHHALKSADRMANALWVVLTCLGERTLDRETTAYTRQLLEASREDLDPALVSNIFRALHRVESAK